MNNQIISNPKVEVPTGMQLNDKDHLNDLLSSLKCLVKDYTVAMSEASNEMLYQQYKTMADQLSLLQRETYELMFHYGWYSLEKAEEMKITNKYQMFSQELQQLNS